MTQKFSLAFAFCSFATLSSSNCTDTVGGWQQSAIVAVSLVVVKGGGVNRVGNPEAVAMFTKDAQQITGCQSYVYMLEKER